jgi:DEAD/DEAH box helicase domain-containing protein
LNRQFNITAEKINGIEDLLRSITSPSLQLRERLHKAGKVNGSYRALCTFSKNGRENLSLPYFFEEIFGTVHSPEKIRKASRGLLIARELLSMEGIDPVVQSASLPRFRFHYFMRNIEGLWASLNVNDSDDGRTVGELLSTAQIGTKDGYRVLELLYCDNCGTLLLGGSRGKSKDEHAYEMLPVTPNIEGIPEKTTAKLVEKRTYQEYMVFWPQGGQEHVPHNPNDDSWDQRKLPGVVMQNDDFDASWNAASLNRFSGQVRHGFKDAERDTKAWIKGLLFRIVERKSGRDVAESNDTHRALPCVCPACGINEDKRKTKFTPIRGFRTGFSKTTQILAKELIYQLPESENNSQRKLVVFSDSREDAAQIANGIERNHYNDLLREIVVREMHNNVLVKSKIAYALKAGEGSLFKESYPELYKDVEAIWLDATDPRAKSNEKIKARTEEAAEELSSLERRLLSVESLIAGSTTKECAPLIAEMIEIGANPAGLDIAFQKNHDTGDSWEKLFDFESKKWKNAAGTFNDKITSEVLSNLATLFFGNLFYSLEASGLGYLTVNQNDATIAVEANKLGISSSELTDVLSASIRIIGHKYYFWPIDIDYDKQPLDLNKDTPQPSALKKYLNSYSEKRGLELKDVWSAVREILTGQGVLRQNGIQLKKLFIKVADESDPVWISERGKRIHLHRAGGICTQYPESTKLSEQPQSICGRIWKQNFLSYHAAIEKRKPIRLHCEELTGQTDDQYTRQRHFRNVILQDEGEKRVKQIDLLSVTTTLEVGVDIGSLQAVMLANMPPQRFNYQQRVGRAGRRGQSYSVVLTFCRGRSHDDHYFSYPEKITGDLPPTPFLTLGQVRILKRLISKEVLRQAFKEIMPLMHDQGNDIHSVHGDFGGIGEWNTYRPEIIKWLTNHHDTIKNIIVALKPGINEHELNDLMNWVVNHTQPGSFVENLDTVIANEEISSPETSEKLAEGGVLPMFGMPTSQKDLYHEITHYSEYGVNSIDRDSSLAIYEFAPGAQKTKDKAIHTAIGFTTELIPRNSGYSNGVGNKEGSPFYNERWMVQCKSCGAVRTEKNNPGSVLCTECNVPSQVYCIKSPVAYRTDYSCGEDSKDNVDILLSRPPIFAETNTDSNIAPFPKNNYEASISDQDVTWRVNTNGDRLFEGRLYVTSNAFPFNPGHNFSFENQWLLESKAQNSDGNGYRFVIKPAADKVEAIALAVNKKTEVFRLHSITVNPALNLDMHSGFKIGVSGVRAAYFSAAFLLQRVLADKLDVDPTEIEIADIRRVPKMNVAEIVLTDELPNGSGFVRVLFSKIEEIINECTTEQRGDSYLAAIHSDVHVKECRDACYDCLKGFRNMNYHGLLDWKLATSLLRSMNNANYTAGADGNFEDYFEIQNWLKEANQLAESFQNSFTGMKVINGNQQLPVIINQDQSKFLIVIHPMWNSFENRENGTLNFPQVTWLGDQISKVIDMAGGDHQKIRFIDTFNLHRRLGWCYQKVFNNFIS